MGKIEKFFIYALNYSTMGKRIVASLPALVARIVGFVIGYFFTSEVIGAVKWLIHYGEHEVPTLFVFLADYNSTVAVVLLALLIIFLVKVIAKFALLNFLTWILIGALVGIVLPMIWPYIVERIQSHGYQLPEWLDDLIKNPKTQGSLLKLRGFIHGR